MQITPPAIANIGWRVFVIFAVFNAIWVPIIYAFFPETSNLSLEDVDHLFEKGGITGGVWGSKGGRTVGRGASRIEDHPETGPEQKTNFDAQGEKDQVEQIER